MRKGTLLMALGLALILGAGGLTGYNLLEANRAEESAQQAVVQLLEALPRETAAAPAAEGETVSLPEFHPADIPDYVRYPQMEMPVVEREGQSYVGILEIPVLQLQLPVISQWSYPALKQAPCRYQGSAYTGDLILLAHNYESHFGRLKDLRPGDRVVFTDMDGNLFSYEVVEIGELPGTAVEEMSAGEWDLTLFTCTYGGRSRVVIRCEE